MYVDRYSGEIISEVPYEKLLTDARVAGGNGRNFGPHYKRFVRLNFATSRRLLDEKLDRIVLALDAKMPG